MGRLGILAKDIVSLDFSIKQWQNIAPKWFHHFPPNRYEI
jgi:hypothetical protein